MLDFVISRREFFAAVAMLGMLSSGDKVAVKELVFDAVRVADALLMAMGQGIE